MDIHTLGQIILGLIGLFSAAYSTWDKHRIKKEQAAEDEKRAKEEKENHERLLEAQKIAADAVAAVQRLTAATLEQKIEDVKAEVQINTQITEKAAEASSLARQEAALSKARWEAVDKVLADKLLAGDQIGSVELSSQKILKDVHKMETETLEIVREVQQAIIPPTTEED